ncbi:hypothetical protein YC2023_107532 [Brassica napus]
MDCDQFSTYDLWSQLEKQYELISDVFSDTLKEVTESWRQSSVYLWDAIPLLQTYGRRAPSGGQVVEKDPTEAAKEDYEITENITDIDCDTPDHR